MSKRGSVIDVMGYVGPVESWKTLGSAIVCQAIYDWREVTGMIKKRGDATKNMLKKKNEAEHFILSNTCELYCGHDGKTIMRRLKQQQRSA